MRSECYKVNDMKKITLFIISLLVLSLAGCATPLHTASGDGDTKTVVELLEKGKYDINERAYDCTPLHYAAMYGQIDTVRLLLDRGADIHAKCKGWDSLTYAASQGHADVAKLLIDRGIDIDNAMANLDRYGGSNSKAGIKLLERLAQNKNKSTQTVAAKSSPDRSDPPSIKSDIDEIPTIMVEPRRNAFAVVIGIENYRSLPKSDYSGKDAALVKSYLKVLGYPERNIDVMTDEKATRTDIEKSLEAWLPNRTKKDSTVIVYFSGHGAPEPSTGEAYIVPYDGDPNYLSVTGYPLKRLYERLGKLEAKEIIVVLDSCFSGAGGRSVLAKGARPLVMIAATGGLSSNMAVMTATQGSQISTSSPEKGHGVFTYYFLKAIKEGNKTLAEIYENIKPQVEDEAKQLNVQQSPSINPDVERLRGRFLLRK